MGVYLSRGRRSKRPHTRYETATPSLDAGKCRQRAERAFVQIKAARELHLDGMHALARAPVFLSRETASVRVIVTNTPPTGARVRLDCIDELGVGALSAAGTGDDIGSELESPPLATTASRSRRCRPALDARHGVSGEDYGHAEKGELALDDGGELAVIGSPNQRQSLLELDGRQAATQRLLTVAGSTPDEAVLHANVGSPAFYDVAIDVTFGSIDVDDVSRDPADEHRRSNSRSILVERVHEEVSVSCDRAGRCRKRLEKTSFEFEPRVGYFNDDGELGPTGIDPIERRAHALKKP
jgi:hypothetical protein